MTSTNPSASPGSRRRDDRQDRPRRQRRHSSRSTAKTKHRRIRPGHRRRRSRSTRPATRSAGSCGSTSPPTSSPAPPTVTDFLPPNEKYLAGSGARDGTDEQRSTSTFDESEAEGGVARMGTGRLGGTVAKGSESLGVAVRHRNAAPRSQSKPEDVTGNLMKFVYSNTAGQDLPASRPGRNRTRRTGSPAEKGRLTRSAACPRGGNGPDQNATGAHGGEKVKYRLDLKNVGNLVAENIELWDRLPAGIECSDVVATRSPTVGECQAGNIIVWKGLEVAAEAEIPSVTYEVTLPTDVAPNQTYVNKAGVRRVPEPDQHRHAFHLLPGRKHRSDVRSRTHAEHRQNQGLGDGVDRRSRPGQGPDDLGHAVRQQRRNAGDDRRDGQLHDRSDDPGRQRGSSASPTITDPLGTRLKLPTGGTLKGFTSSTASINSRPRGVRRSPKKPATRC